MQPLSFFITCCLVVVSLTSQVADGRGICRQFFSTHTQTSALVGRKLWWQPYRVEDESFRVTAYKPLNGVGSLIQVERLNEKGITPTLWEAAMAYPKYFARFDIRADRDHLILPDAIRLNHLNAGGAQFMNLPGYRMQIYSEAYFRRMLVRKGIPLGSRRRYFEHDRLGVHLLGAIVMPPWLYKAFVLNPDHDAGLWDRMTAQLAYVINRVALKKNVTAYEIGEFRHILQSDGQRLIGGHLIQDGLPNVTGQFALNETIRILHELTGIDVAELLQTWNSRPEQFRQGWYADQVR